MSSEPQYVLDANVFIEAKKRYYAFDICPSFWSLLLDLHAEDRICSIDRIRKQLTDYKDELSTWANENVPESFFKATSNQDVIDEFAKFVEWIAGHPQFTQAAKDEFADDADGWLIAYARVHDMIVVTHEALNPGIKKKVPIPNVCAHFGVPYANTFDMLRELGSTLG